jgi:hypothetical protein
MDSTQHKTTTLHSSDKHAFSYHGADEDSEPHDERPLPAGGSTRGCPPLASILEETAQLVLRGEREKKGYSNRLDDGKMTVELFSNTV